MRRVELRILTASWKRNYGYGDLFRVVEKARVLQNLTLTQQLFVDLWEVRLLAGRNAHDLVGLFGIESASQVASGGGRTLVVVRAPFHGFLKKLYFEYGVSFQPPIEFKSDAIRVTLIGADSAMARALAYLRRSTIQFETLSAGLFEGAGSEILAGLTPHQRKVLEVAFGRGYFEVPALITARGLAKQLGTSHQAVVDTLHRAERHLITAALRAEGWGEAVK
jgi:hypothetical protein